MHSIFIVRSNSGRTGGHAVEIRLFLGTGRPPNSSAFDLYPENFGTELVLATKELRMVVTIFIAPLSYAMKAIYVNLPLK
jgi:hypothetical protein